MRQALRPGRVEGQRDLGDDVGSLRWLPNSPLGRDVLGQAQPRELARR
jgi:hypothetical protein